MCTVYMGFPRIARWSSFAGIPCGHTCICLFVFLFVWRCTSYSRIFHFTMEANIQVGRKRIVPRSNPRTSAVCWKTFPRTAGDAAGLLSCWSRLPHMIDGRQCCPISSAANKPGDGRWFLPASEWFPSSTCWYMSTGGVIVMSSCEQLLV